MLPLKDYVNWFKMFPPESATEEEWAIFAQNCKTKFPIRFWLNETLIPSTWDYVKNAIPTIKDYVNKYVLDRLHMINTKLPPGAYDLETRLLNGLFSLLVDFVEVQCASMVMNVNKDLEKTSWWKKPSEKDNREKGLNYLDWEINLKNNKSKDIGESTISLSQSEAAELTKKLYLWWKDERPKRENPYRLLESSNFEKGKSLADWIKKDDPERDKVLKQIHDMETKYEEEDTEMLIQLVKLRTSLWT